MITMTSVVATHSTRLWTESVAAHVPACKQRPSALALGGIVFDNSTGVSAVRCRHR